MSNLYTPTELDFIRTNYDTIGATWCGRQLKRNPESLRKIAKAMGLKGPTVRYKPDTERNVNPDHFRDIRLPEVAYFLGYFWADGHIHTYRTEHRNITHHRVAIEVEREDGLHLRSIAERFGRWNIVERQRKRYGVDMKPVLGLIVNNEPVYTFLKDHGYDDKSVLSPDLILAKIPDHLKPAFWLGFLDGDGSITMVRKSPRHATVYNIQFAGSREQDWNALEALMHQLGIKCSLRREIRPNGNARSIVLVQNQFGIHAFNDYVKPFAHLGLPRKRKKLDDFVEHHPKIRSSDG